MDSALAEATLDDTVSVDLASTPVEAFLGESAAAAAAAACSLS